MRFSNRENLVGIWWVFCGDRLTRRRGGMPGADYQCWERYSAGVYPARSVLKQGEAGEAAQKSFGQAGVEKNRVDEFVGEKNRVWEDGSLCRSGPGRTGRAAHIVGRIEWKGTSDGFPCFGVAFLGEGGWRGKYCNVFFDRIPDAIRDLGRKYTAQ